METKIELTFKDSFEDGEGTRKVRKFLKEFINGFCERSCEYYQSLGEFIFAYREKQLTTIINPLLHELSGGKYQAECPTKRRDRDKLNSSHGWVDYWVKLDENTILVIELKHGYHSYRNNSIRGDVIQCWADVNYQLNTIKQEDFKENNNQKVFKISLMVITSYYGSSKEDGYIESHNPSDKRSVLEKLNEGTDGRIMKSGEFFEACWDMTQDEDMYQPYEYIDSYEYYPQVHFVGRVIP